MRSLLSFGHARGAARGSTDLQGAAAGVTAVHRSGRAARAVAVSMLASLAVLIVACTPASASQSFAFASSFGSFSEVTSIAISEPSEDVYVYDSGKDAIYKYDAAGKPVTFSSTATNVISGVGGNIAEAQVAVDNSSGPAKGDIYVANASHVAIFASTGEPLGSITHEAGQPWGEPCGVAVDTLGNVYVGVYAKPSGYVNKYVPSANPVTNAGYASSIGGVETPCNVAVDSGGNVFAETFYSGPITRYEPSQFGSLSATGSRVTAAGSTLAVDPTSQDVFVDEGKGVSQYGPSGEPFEEPVNRFAAVGPGAITNSFGIAVSKATKDVYVSDGAGHVNVFTSVILADVTTGEASSIAVGSATLEGSVNPAGVAVTACSFEYGPTTNYGYAAPCTQNPGAGASPVDVTASVGGLEPATTYHYRLVARNANGSNVGSDGTFETLTPPGVSGETAYEVETTSAVVNAWINPYGLSTTYHLEYGTDTSYGESVPASDASAGAGTSVVSVNNTLRGLREGTVYHYRIVATNLDGITDGPDKLFETAHSRDNCPNSGLRAEQAATQLPDCRAYEMVSPVEKNGADVQGDVPKGVLAAESGNRAQFMTRTGFGDTHGSGAGGYTQFVASRASNGWFTNAITPTPALNTPVEALQGETFDLAFTAELDRAVVSGYDLPGVSGAVPGAENLYLEATKTAQLIEPITGFNGIEATPTDAFAMKGILRGATPDLGVVLFETPVNLVPPAAGNVRKLYAHEHGVTHLVGVMPDGSVPVGGSASPFGEGSSSSTWVYNDVLSDDGSRILFVSPASGSGQQLYMRKNATSTVWVSKSEATSPSVEPQGVYFQAATADGRKVLFTSVTPLVDQDPGNVSGSGTKEIGLYMYTDGPDPEAEANLTFIARVSVSNGGSRPDEHEVVKAVSGDGERVYFYSEPLPGLPFKKQGSAALFLWDAGQIHQIAPAPGVDSGAAIGQASEFRVTPDGRRLAFMFPGSLVAGQEVRGLPLEHAEIYLYDETTDKVDCVSCPPGGEAAKVGVELGVEATEPQNPSYQLASPIRYFSSDGRYIFFNTTEGLLPQDTNNITDAYEYDRTTGKLSLLSSGVGDIGTWFAEATPNGSDVLLLTREKLTGWDPDKLSDLYDARVNGGFPEPRPPTAPCAGDECQGTPSAAPSFNTASEFSGRGNPVSGPIKSLNSKVLTRAQLLRRALSVCRKKPKHRRHVCEVRAKRRYGGKRSAKRVPHRAGR